MGDRTGIADAAARARQVAERKAVVHRVIGVEGAREHNLRNIDVYFPRGALTVVTGVSGSGKSSLAFDTLFAEGQREYLESLSSYARRTLDRLPRPDVDAVLTTSPSVAIRQHVPSRNPRSTVGTIAEVSGHLRLLFSRGGQHTCLTCGAPVPPPARGTDPWVCGACGREARATSSDHFSPNTPTGMCPTCQGLGHVLGVDPGSLVTDPAASIRAGAISFYGDRRTGPEKTFWPVRDLVDLLAVVGATIDTPWQDIAAPARDIVLTGATDRELGPDLAAFVGARTETGLVPEILRLFTQAETAKRKAFYQRFMTSTACSACGGSQLAPDALAVELAGCTIADVNEIPVVRLGAWLDRAERELRSTSVAGAVAEPIAQIRSRVGSIERVGLGYLTLRRPAPSLSAGEGQRLRIARQLGSSLVEMVYVLDEPSIGLHPRDASQLGAILRDLCSRGNTVIVVEHDIEMMLEADWIVELGPGAGEAGGDLIAVGPPDDLRGDHTSITGALLRGELHVDDRRGRRRQPSGWAIVEGARTHNLKDVDCAFPVGAFTCVTGVSGSGKSSLVTETLLPAARAVARGVPAASGQWRATSGLEVFDRVASVTQAPLGRSSRSVPATYAKVFDDIRRLFAALPSSRSRGYGERHFSFNSDSGGCPACGGAGDIEVGMHFLADAAVTCPACRGRRYRDEVLEVELDGQTIADVLDMDVDHARRFFGADDRIAVPLSWLSEVGLGYLKLGQKTSTLSGGEAQRLKLSRELGRTDHKHVLYVIDEPTTGLHLADVGALCTVLHGLVDRGNTVVVVEHNIDLVKTADWIVDLGPGAADEGGEVVAAGTPEAVAGDRASLLAPFLDQALAESTPGRDRQWTS